MELREGRSTNWNLLSTRLAAESKSLLCASGDDPFEFDPAEKILDMVLVRVLKILPQTKIISNFLLFVSVLITTAQLLAMLLWKSWPRSLVVSAITTAKQCAWIGLMVCSNTGCCTLGFFWNCYMTIYYFPHYRRFLDRYSHRSLHVKKCNKHPSYWNHDKRKVLFHWQDSAAPGGKAWHISIENANN